MDYHSWRGLAGEGVLTSTEQATSNQFCRELVWEFEGWEDSRYFFTKLWIYCVFFVSIFRSSDRSCFRRAYQTILLSVCLLRRYITCFSFFSLPITDSNRSHEELVAINNITGCNDILLLVYHHWDLLSYCISGHLPTPTTRYPHIKHITTS